MTSNWENNYFLDKGASCGLHYELCPSDFRHRLGLGVDHFSEGSKSPGPTYLAIISIEGRSISRNVSGTSGLKAPDGCWHSVRS